MEVEVRAPGLVDHQRDAVGSGRPRPAPRPGRRRRSRSARRSSPPPASGSPSERGVERLRRHAVGDPELRIDLGRDEGRAAAPRGRARRSSRSGRCAGPPPGRGPAARSRASRGRGRRPCRSRGFRPRRRSAGTSFAAPPRPRPRAAGRAGTASAPGPTSIPSIPPGRRGATAAAPSASTSSGSAPVPLWPGMWKRPGSAVDVGDAARRGRGLRAGRSASPSRVRPTPRAAARPPAYSEYGYHHSFGGDLALDVHVLGLLEGLEALAAELAARAPTA